MDRIDQELEEKRIEEEQRRAREEAEKKGEKPPVITVPKPHVVKTKNLTIKEVTGMGSLRVKSQADIDTFVADLKKQLEKQLEDDTIVNIEF